jgi:hypothetical protein
VRRHRDRRRSRVRFDSNAADVAEGATQIPASFIVEGRVKGYRLNASGARVTPVITATCRIRN